MPFAALCPCGANLTLPDDQRLARLRCPECGQHWLNTGQAAGETAAPEYPGSEVLEQPKLRLRSRRRFRGFVIQDDQGKPCMLIQRESQLAKHVLGTFMFVLLIYGMGFFNVPIYGSDGPPFLAKILYGNAFWVILACVPVTIALLIWAINSPKEHIRIFLPGDPKHPVLTLQCLATFRISKVHYLVRDESGEILATTRQIANSSLFGRRRLWHLRSEDGRMLCVACDDLRYFEGDREGDTGSPFALFRRHGIIRAADGDTTVATIQKVPGFTRDFILDLTPDQHHWLDRRIALAAALLYWQSNAM